MCGRYQLRQASRYPGIFKAQPIGDVIYDAPHNVCPSELIPVIRVDGTLTRQLTSMRWGFVPSWPNGASIGNRIFNARAESAAEKRSFRTAMKQRRCLIPADGYYEWKKLAGGATQPHLFTMADGEPFAMAGLWETWEGGGTPLETCTILTSAPNALITPVNDRMPVILHKHDYSNWLDSGRRVEDVAPLLASFPAELMIDTPIDRNVERGV